jgi:uncharacterized protein YtpQ (UPF0354 family)
VSTLLAQAAGRIESGFTASRLFEVVAAMSGTELTEFEHPQKAFRLKFPKHWEHRVEKEGMSCGFGPYERDNVGLWISILPARIDTDRMHDDLPKLFQQALDKAEATNLRRDESLQHFGLKADRVGEGDGGNYWIVTGGDLVLFASSQVPEAEREAWNPLFEQVMSSLKVTREDDHARVKLAIELCGALREAYPDQDYHLEEDGVRGKDHRLSVDNLFREIRDAPDRKERLLKKFVEAVAPSRYSKYGHEQWEEVAHRVFPVLKPRNYIRPGTTTERLIIQEWLLDVVICYAIQSDDTIRFVTDWDRDRWKVDDETLHKRAMRNLVSLDWPHRLEGARQPGGGRLIMITTGDGFAASRLLHPDLHRLMSSPLGSPFYAGIPDRDTFVVLSHHAQLRRKIARQVRKDFNKSAYQIAPQLFLVTADGIAPAEDATS